MHGETAGVFVAVLIFQFSITMSLIIVSILLMVDLEVYGLIYMIGAKLNCKLTFHSLKSIAVQSHALKSLQARSISSSRYLILVIEAFKDY